jgi:3-hydroxyacyl-CoA dehydrogenase/enoyl-CoA hydratase/3-hydroxybutyryl-CoA epimerase
MARKQVLRQAGRLYPAPHAVLDTLRDGFGKPIEQRLTLEREALSTLVMGDVCHSLVSIFRRTRDKDRGTPYSDAPGSSGMNSIAVIGGGVMGSGIAMLLLLKGKEVRIIDPFPDALGRAMAAITKELDSRVRRRHMDRKARERTLSALTLSTDFDGLRGADLIIEAVPEVPDIKRDALQQCAARLAPNAILTSNTSSLSLTTLEEHVDDAGRFAGLHFFNPAPKMPLVEVVLSGGTDHSTTGRLIRFCREIGKTAVVSKDSPAFVVNRLLAPYLVAAASLAMEGAGIKQIDRVAKKFGLPMGPFALMDTVGLDVASHVCEYLSSFPELGIKRPDLLQGMLDAGRLGRKSGRGFYDYSKKRKKLCKDTPGLPAEARAFSQDEIKNRLLDALSGEARRIMAEEVVASADDLDLASIFGMGFPPYTAGIATWAGLQEKVTIS